MSGGIYVLRDDGELVTLSQRQYDSEDLLQMLLAKYPSILAGDQISPSTPRQWLLVKREVEVPGEEGGGGRWSLDHLFLDQDGIPTLVEVKRSTDTRIRREVVGQMLDYAANAMAYWSIESVQTSFEQTCAKRSQVPDSVLADFLGSGGDPDTFWQKVKTNLQAGKLRLLFVADEIPNELRRVVEFLNSQMDPAEVLAVEIKQFAGESLKTLVPRVIGQTAEAERRKGPGKRATRQWDEESFFAELERKRGSAEAEIARKLYSWSKQNLSRITWGHGTQLGSMFPVLDHGDNWHVPFAVWTNGFVETQFQYQANKPPFDDPDERRELLRRFNEVPGVSLPDDAIDRRPSIPLSTFGSDEALTQFFSVIEWFVDKARKT
jgi:hypothetical protein